MARHGDGAGALLGPPRDGGSLVRGARRCGRRHRGVRGRRIRLQGGPAGRRAGRRTARRISHRVRVRRRAASPGWPVGRDAAPHDGSGRRLDRSDHRLVDRSRSQLGHVQPGRRVRRVPRARGRARRRGPARGRSSRRVGARDRRGSRPRLGAPGEVDSGSRPSRRPGCAAQRAGRLLERARAHREHRAAAGALGRRVARTGRSRSGSSAASSRTPPYSSC